MKDFRKRSAFIPTLGMLSASLVWTVNSTLCAAPAGNADMAGSSAHAAAPAKESGSSSQVQKGEMSENIRGTDKQKVKVGKADPPAAFNLEDIQNFPEERLQPVLNSAVNFEEGRDFSTMMDFHESRLIHPWLPELSKSPFLSLKTETEKPAKDWTFSIIDQSGNTVSQQAGKGAPPAVLYWTGDDSKRGSAAVDTVYIPQLAISDKEGYHHTFMGQPVQLSALIFKESGKTVMELSSKRLFQENKFDFTKEAPTLLDKVCDEIREDARLPFAVQSYDTDTDLGRSRQAAVSKYLSNALNIPTDQIVQGATTDADKRGSAIAILMNAIPGGSH